MDFVTDTHSSRSLSIYGEFLISIYFPLKKIVHCTVDKSIDKCLCRETSLRSFRDKKCKENFMTDKPIKPADNQANMQNPNKGFPNNNRQYDQNQGNRGKQKNPNQKKK